MQISHAYSQTVADGTATSVVRPSDWNSNHNIVLHLSGNTLGSSRLTGQALTFVGGNNVTLSADTANSRLNFVGPSQSVQTQPSGNIVGAGYTSTTQNGSTVGLTQNSQGLSAAWPSFLTTQTVQTQAAGNIARTGYTSTTQAGLTVGATLNTNGLSMAWPPFLTAAPAQTVQPVAASGSNGSFNFSTLSFGNSNGVSFYTTNGSVVASYTVPAAQTVQTQPAGNIAGIGTTFNGTNIAATIALNSNGLNLSLSGDGGVVNQTGPNIAVAGSTITGGTVLFSNANGVSFGINGQTLTASAAGGGGGAPDRRFKEVVPGERFTTIVALSATQVTNRPIFLPFWMEGTGLAVNTARLMMSFGASSNRSLGGTFHLGLYMQNNNTQMTLLTSNSWSASSTASSATTAWNGVAWVDFGLGGYTITSEGRYILALQVNPVSANQTWMPVSLYGADPMPLQSRVIANGTTQALNSQSQFLPFWGAYSTTSAGLPASVALTQINGASSQFQMQFYAMLREI